ncbi:Kelch repeat-containing protein [Sorangium sp. So ce1128]
MTGGVESGENGAALDSAELYDPAADAWTPAASMLTARLLHTATLLPSGRVLVTGGVGVGDSPFFGSAELYDPAADTWTPAASMNYPRFWHTATLLPNGQVLVAGGIGELADNSAELYDPAADTWTLTEIMHDVHLIHTATLLPTGEVLVVGPSRYSERYTLVGATCRSDADCALAPCVDGVCCDDAASVPTTAARSCMTRRSTSGLSRHP